MAVLLVSDDADYSVAQISILDGGHQIIAGAG